MTLIFLKEACLSRHEVNIELNKSRFSLMSFVLLLPFVEHCKRKISCSSVGRPVPPIGHSRLKNMQKK